MDLREALLIIGNEDDGKSPVPQEAIDQLIARGLLFKGGPKYVDLTEDGYTIFLRAKKQKATPELD